MDALHPRRLDPPLGEPVADPAPRRVDPVRVRVLRVGRLGRPVADDEAGLATRGFMVAVAESGPKTSVSGAPGQPAHGTMTDHSGYRHQTQPRSVPRHQPLSANGPARKDEGFGRLRASEGWRLKDESSRS